ncbi:MAG: hypothetical protein REI09_08215 [Candidatus Dactylopiibacterium sp.]|nr:hypothetical protein [Candidatus Dactylopiibacterium sp.]
MPAWLPLLKASLPYVTQLVTAAIPAFTARHDPKDDPLLTQQIEELQRAATHNAEAVRGLAEKLRQTIQTLDDAAAELERKARLFRTFALINAAVAMVALGVAFVALLR